VSEVGDVGVGDIVFCQVKPTWRYFVHAVMSKDSDREVGAWCFTIGNGTGWRKGWCWIDDIYGKLKRISRDHVP